jgi:HAE1 family hydrophobic/amphiphilic exporter-1
LSLLGIVGDEFTYYPIPSISPPMVNVTADYPGSNGELMIKSVISFRTSLEWCSGNEIHDFDAGNDGEASIQVVFNLGTDPNRLMFKIVWLRWLITTAISGKREGVKITREVPSMLMYVNL